MDARDRTKAKAYWQRIVQVADVSALPGRNKTERLCDV